MSWGKPSDGDDAWATPATEEFATPTDTGFASGDARNHSVDNHNEGFGGTAGGGDGEGCFNCGAQGHMKNECPNARQSGNDGACFNCGETGHNKSDCPNAAIAREFTGECRLCNETGHRAVDCPAAPPKLCKNCNGEGHAILECKNPRAVDRSDVPTVKPEEAWAEITRAVEEKDLDDIKEALQKYVKAIPEITYCELEKAFRTQDLNLYIIAMEKEMSDTYTNMDLQGVLEHKFTISYRFSDKPMRPKEKDGWPATPEENFERLADAGEAVDRGIPKCNNCDQMGHVRKNCNEEIIEPTDRAEVKCYNCDVTGHRVRDCPTPRPDKFSCRNCGKSGHSSKECPEPRDESTMECRKCNEMGHSSRNCPQGGGGGNRNCFNCGQEGHSKNDCTNEHVDICRNCDAVGHISKECPKPRDWSRVTCSNCQQKGHTKVRCKEPNQEDAGGDGAHGNAEVVVSDPFDGGGNGGVVW